MWLKLLCLCVFTWHVCADIVYTEEKEDYYDVVGIFEKQANVTLLAFKDSMKSANKGALRLKPSTVVPSKADSYSVWKDFCSNNAAMPIAVVGPPNAFTDGAIRDQCTKAHIPHIQAAWQPIDPDIYTKKPKENVGRSQEDEETDAYDINPKDEEEGDKVEEEQTDEEPTFKPISINFYPNADELSEAYVELLKFYEWGMFAVLYEDDFGLMRIQKILAGITTQHPIAVRRLDPEGENHDEILKEILKVYDEGRILIDCHVDNVMKYLTLAKKLNLLDLYQQIVLTTMDASIIAEELESFPPNITWLSMSQYETLTDPQHSLVARVGEWVRGDTRISNPLVMSMKTEALMMDDIANHLLKAMENITDFRKPSYNACDKNGDPWESGARLQHQLLKTESKGATGRILFDDQGKRINYTLYVNEKSMLKRHTIGKWESDVGGPIQRLMLGHNTTGVQDQPKKKFTIIARIAEPYFFEKKKEYDENGELIEGEQYEGFSVDLIKKIFESLKTKMGLEYTYEFRHEKQFQDYGEFDPDTKKWTGLIGALLDKKADMAVCDITITERRKSVVDFSVPFMTLGISILYVKERKVNPGTFSFLYPYEFEVWIYTATAYCVVSIILFVCSRISPADWENPQPCDKDPEELENIWNFKNCTWLTMGSIMTQGCDILPKAIGSRWVCGMWWFFAMIVCQTYIAQLSASMTSALETEPINSVEDLAKQTKIRYGALRKGATFEFFRNSKDKIYQKIYNNMVKNDVVLVGSNEEGEKRVINGNNKYAYFMESSTIEYKLRRNCQLKQIGGTLDSKDYGIAMPANSPFRSQINAALLDLKELNKLDEIKKKYWDNSTYGALDCDRDGPDKNDVEGDLEMENLIGAFLVLIVGLFFCLFITAAEFMNEVRNIVVREQLTHKEAFVQELKASLNLTRQQKPVIRNPSRAPSMDSSDDAEDDGRERSRIALQANFMEQEKRPQ